MVHAATLYLSSVRWPLPSSLFRRWGPQHRKSQRLPMFHDQKMPACIGLPFCTWVEKNWTILALTGHRPNPRTWMMLACCICRVEAGTLALTMVNASSLPLKSPPRLVQLTFRERLVNPLYFIFSTCLTFLHFFLPSLAFFWTDLFFSFYSFPSSFESDKL